MTFFFVALLLDLIFSLHNKKAKVDGVNYSANYCHLECDAM